MNKYDKTAAVIGSPSLFFIVDAYNHEADKTYNQHLALNTAAAFVIVGVIVFALGYWEQYKKDRAEAERRAQAIAEHLNKSFLKNIK